MKDILAYLLTVSLTIFASYYTCWKPVVPMLMFVYFPVERITRERKRRLRNFFVKGINKYYVKLQVMLTLCAFYHVYSTKVFLPSIKDYTFMGIVFLPTVYETIVYQGFMMGYWNHNPALGIMITSILQASQYYWDYSDEVVIVMFLHSLIDNVALEKQALYKIGVKKIFVRFILYIVAKIS